MPRPGAKKKRCSECGTTYLKYGQEFIQHKGRKWCPPCWSRDVSNIGPLTEMQKEYRIALRRHYGIEERS